MNTDSSIYQLVSSYLNDRGQQIVTIKIKGTLTGVFTISAIKLVTDEKAMLSGFSADDIVSIIGLLATEKQVSVVQTSRLGRFKFLPVLAMLFITCMAVAAISSTKLIALFHFTLAGGVFVIPIGYLISSVVVEVYGYKHARQLIWGGLICSILMVIMLHLAVLLPPSILWHNQNEFALTLSIIPRLLIAIWVGYIIGSFLSTFCLSKFKLWKFKLNLRIFIAFIIGILVETILFVVVAFYDKISNFELGILVINMSGVKLGLSILFVPLAIYITKLLKRVEDVDIVDISTNFTPFSLNTDYDISNNLSRTVH
jgi:queuosine precursor transporter